MSHPNPITTATTPQLEIKNLSRDFVNPLGLIEQGLNRLGAQYNAQTVRAVSEVDLTIERRQVLGLVGESGCGKSTLGRMVAGLIKPTKGEVNLDGTRFDLGGCELTQREMLPVQMVFQNPMSSLNPRQRVIDILTEGPLLHGLITRAEKTDYALSLCAEVGLSQDALPRLPHQFSGGQRQRIGIARALSVKPKLLICDEPVAALDVSIQAQIINLFILLQKKRGLTLLFISHDLGVVKHLCDEIAVMYLGRIVERAPTATLFDQPRHPYAQALLKEMPQLTIGRRAYHPTVGEIPSPLNPPKGCHFHPRCPVATDRCRVETPQLRKAEGNHDLRCWL